MPAELKVPAARATRPEGCPFYVFICPGCAAENCVQKLGRQVCQGCGAEAEVQREVEEW